MDRAAFYDVMRDKFGTLSQSQVDGTEKLLDEGEKRHLPMNQLSYVLSTAWHETAATMQPIAEYGKGEGHDYGEPCEEYNNQVAYGRGYVQLTWDYNYEKADSKCALNGALLENFDLALDPPIAAQIIFQGMDEGWFTGKKLTDYVNDEITDYYNARRVVNGTDRADMLADYAENFEQALRTAGYHLTEPPVTPELEPPPIEITWPGPKYEYLVEIPGEEFTTHFNERGSEGWRFAGTVDSKIVWERMKTTD